VTAAGQLNGWSPSMVVPSAVLHTRIAESDGSSMPMAGSTANSGCALQM